MTGSKLNSRNILLFISDLDFAKSGNQILFNTVLGTIRNDFDVILFTSSPYPNNNFDMIEVPDKYKAHLIIIRFKPIFRAVIVTLNNVFQRIINSTPSVTSSKFKRKHNTTNFTYYPTLSFISFFLGGVFKAAKIIIKYKPKLVCGYEPRGVLLGWFLSKLFRVNYFSRFQGTLLFPEMDNRIKAYMKYPFYLITMRLPSKLVYMENDGTRGKEVLLKLGVAENRIKFRIDGVSKTLYIANYDKAYLYKTYNIKKDSKIILTVSRLVEWKRVDRAILAMKEVVDNFPKTVLVIVGGGDYEHALRKLSCELELENNIIFTGPVTHFFIKYFMNSCDIFLSLYDHSNLCNPVLEALECGRCIISINDGSTSEILVNNKNALLVEKNDLANKLPQYIAKCLTDDKLRTELMKNAKRFAETHLLSWEDRMSLENEEVKSLLNE